MQNKYVLKKVIGEGGMSRVYLAYDVRLHKKWAVKEIDCKNGQDHFLTKAMRAEANVLRRIDHKYLPRIVDVYEEDSRVFLVMDYIEGMSLQEYLEEKGRVKAEEVLSFGIQITEALQYLHGMHPKIIYRDMKPSNIILRGDGTICLIDFGTARLMGKEKAEAFGTKGYAPCEQYRNEADERSDIYALGMTLFQLLTGIQPVSKKQVRRELSGSRNKISSGMKKIILKAVEEKPEKRYQSAKRLREALLLEQKRTPVYIRRKRMLGAGILIAVSSFAAVLFYGNSYKEQQMDRQEEAYRLAVESGNDALLAGDTVAAAGQYEKAITQIDGTNPEAYIRLLALYVRKGDAKEGVLRIRGYLDSDFQGIGSNEELLFETGKVCFYECRDYKSASLFFERLQGKQKEEAAYYQALCRCLMEVHINPVFLQDTLQKFYSFNEQIASIEEKTQNNLMIAEIYLMYGEEMEEGLKRAEKILMENEKNDINEDSLRMLTTIYRLLGKQDSRNRAEYYKKSMGYIKQLLERPGIREEGTVYRMKLCDMADMYEELGNSIKAAECYEECEKYYPCTGREVYKKHLYLLVKQKAELEQIQKVLKQAEKVEGMSTDKQFQKLTEKIRIIYAKGEQETYEQENNLQN